MAMLLEETADQRNKWIRIDEPTTLRHSRIWTEQAAQDGRKAVNGLLTQYNAKNSDKQSTGQYCTCVCG